MSSSITVYIDEPGYFLHPVQLPTIPMLGDHVVWKRPGEEPKIGVVKRRRICSRITIIVGDVCWYG